MCVVQEFESWRILTDVRLRFHAFVFLTTNIANMFLREVLYKKIH